MDTEPQVSLEMPPFRLDGKQYTKEETEKIISFFKASDYRSFLLPVGFRDGRKIFENLPIKAKENEYQSLINRVVPVLLSECHPTLHRSEIVVRFVSKISQELDGREITPGAECLDVKDGKKQSYWIRVSLEDAKEMGEENLIPNIVYRILHEISETDYYLKSKGDIKDPNEDPNSKSYPYSEDEEIANRRAFRVLKQIFPEVGFDDIHYNDL